MKRNGVLMGLTQELVRAAHEEGGFPDSDDEGEWVGFDVLFIIEVLSSECLSFMRFWIFTVRGMLSDFILSFQMTRRTPLTPPRSLLPKTAPVTIPAGRVWIRAGWK